MHVCPQCQTSYPPSVWMCPTDGTPLATRRDPMLGRVVGGGRYRLFERLGSGGMSQVYLARHIVINRLVAVKTLRASLSLEAEQRERFLREARAVNRINHPNITEITDYGETEDGLVYLVMEYVPGTPLAEFLVEPLQWQRVFRIARQVVSGLARAHEMGVVHRDLKPDNILIVTQKDGEEVVKLLDFGIAKVDRAPLLTHSQQIFGTPGYIAPEYIQSGTFDGRADLYSLGVMLYELLTGQLPFEYDYPGDLLVKHLSEAPIPIELRNPNVEVPDRVRAFVMRCLEKEPSKRFRDAHHCIELIDKILDPSIKVANRPEEWTQLGHKTGNSSRAEQEAYNNTKSSAPEAPPAFARRSESPETLSEELATRQPTQQKLSQRKVRDTVIDELKVHIPTPTDGLLGADSYRRRLESIQTLHPEAHDDLLPCEAKVLEMETIAQAVSKSQKAIEELVTDHRQAQDHLGCSLDRVAKELSVYRGFLQDTEDHVTRLQGALFSGHAQALEDEASVRIRGAYHSELAKHRERASTETLTWELATFEQKKLELSTHTDDLECQIELFRDELLKAQNEHEGEMDLLMSNAQKQIAELHELKGKLDPLLKGWENSDFPD